MLSDLFITKKKKINPLLDVSHPITAHLALNLMRLQPEPLRGPG